MAYYFLAQSTISNVNGKLQRFITKTLVFHTRISCAFPLQFQSHRIASLLKPINQWPKTANDQFAYALNCIVKVYFEWEGWMDRVGSARGKQTGRAFFALKLPEKHALQQNKYSPETNWHDKQRMYPTNDVVVRKNWSSPIVNNSLALV